MSRMVKVTVDGRTVEVPAGTLVTDAAREAEVHVPIFCSHAKLPPLGACRICVVEVGLPNGRVTGWMRDRTIAGPAGLMKLTIKSASEAV